MSDLHAHLSAEFARRRARNPRYSLRAFARHLGVDHATLSQWLRGRRPISPRSAAGLLASLGVDMDADRTAALGPSHRAILDLVRAPGFVADSRWIARSLDVDVDHVNCALQTLIRLNLLAMPARDRWIANGGHS